MPYPFPEFPEIFRVDRSRHDRRGGEGSYFLVYPPLADGRRGEPDYRDTAGAAKAHALFFRGEISWPQSRSAAGFFREAAMLARDPDAVCYL